MEPVVKRLRSAPDPEHAWASIESMSMRHYLHHVVGYSAAAVRLIEVVLDEASLLDAALAETVRTMAHAWSSETFLAVVTGFSSLPDRLARELSRPVFTEAHVVGLGQGLGGVTASVRVGKSDALQRVMADRVIVAVPAGLSRKIRFDPPLSPRKSRALRALRYHNAVKVFVQFREPFWLDDGLDGRIATTDLPNRFVFYPAGASRVVLATTRGDRTHGSGRRFPPRTDSTAR
jgi:monoamine oxidase